MLGGENFLYLSVTSMGTTQLPVQQIFGLTPKGKAAGALR